MKIKKGMNGTGEIGAALAASSSVSHEARPAKMEPARSSFQALDEYIQQHMKKLNIPGVSLAVVEDGQIVHMRGFGKAYPGGGPPSPQTAFVIGSLTKSFTALAILQLVENNQVDPDSRVQNYLPWFRVLDAQASARITVRHLLNQTSGLSQASGRIPLADFDDHPNATERQARSLATIKLSHPPGSRYEYSNSNYNLLGLIIEEASGESYADYVRKHIFDPLEMKHSYASKDLASRNDLAVGHQYWFSIPIPVPGLPLPGGSLPSGQLISCAEDMAHYLIAHLNAGCYENAQILSPAGIDSLHQGVEECTEMGISMGRYGMGWFISGSGVTQNAWHTGIVPDYFSFMALLPEQKKGVILLFNVYGYLMTPALSEVGAGVTSLLAGEQPGPIKTGFLVWVQRLWPLLPLLQIIGITASLRSYRRSRAGLGSQSRTVHRHLQSTIFPLVSVLLPVLSLIPRLVRTREFWALFMPDLSWISRVCGGLANGWVFLQIWTILGNFRKSHSPRRNKAK